MAALTILFLKNALELLCASKPRFLEHFFLDLVSLAYLSPGIHYLILFEVFWKLTRQ